MREIINNGLRLVSKSYYAFKLAEKIVYFHKNENNANPLTNGEANFLKQHRGGFKVIFDVGANVGDWSRLANTYIPGARIFAFEPFKASFEELQRTKFAGDNVNSYNMALAERPGTGELFVYELASAFNSLYDRKPVGIAASQKVTVEIQTLDGFCAGLGIKNIDFLKIDVEGAELSVLRGAEAMISGKRIKAIQFEYGGTYIDARCLLKDIYEFFEGKNYLIHKVFPEELIPMERYDYSQEDFQYANYIAVLK